MDKMYLLRSPVLVSLFGHPLSDRKQRQQKDTWKLSWEGNFLMLRQSHILHVGFGQSTTGQKLNRSWAPVEQVEPLLEVQVQVDPAPLSWLKLA